jgi:hypothetical protein
MCDSGELTPILICVSSAMFGLRDFLVLDEDVGEESKQCPRDMT